MKGNPIKQLHMIESLLFAEQLLLCAQLSIMFLGIVKFTILIFATLLLFTMLSAVLNIMLSKVEMFHTSYIFTSLMLKVEFIYLIYLILMDQLKKLQIKKLEYLFHASVIINYIVTSVIHRLNERKIDNTNFQKPIPMFSAVNDDNMIQMTDFLVIKQKIGVKTNNQDRIMELQFLQQTQAITEQQRYFEEDIGTPQTSTANINDRA